jgi:hypothetical protein
MSNEFDDAICEYCGCMLRYAFNRIRRHSQPEDKKHKQGNIPVCKDCIQSMYLKGDLAIDANSHKWQFKEDILKKVGPNVRRYGKRNSQLNIY